MELGYEFRSETSDPHVRTRIERQKMLKLLAVLVSVPPVVWFGAYLTLSDDLWWMFVANSVAHLLFVPVGIVLVIGLVLRNRSLILVSLMPTIIALGLFGTLFLPIRVRGWLAAGMGAVPSEVRGTASAPLDAASSASSARSRLTFPQRLTLMTFNLNADNVDAENVLQSIVAADADVVALQEVGETMGRLLREKAQEIYPYVTFTGQGGWGGLAILSRYPFSPGRGVIKEVTQGNPLEIVLHVAGRDIDVVNLHNPSFPREVDEWRTEIPGTVSVRGQVARSIATLARDACRPLLVMGDFNTTARSAAYRILANELRDSWREAGIGLGNTFPGGPLGPTPLGLRLPSWLIRIDYVFHDEAFVGERARIGRWDGFSDHRPVVVDVRWSGTSDLSQRVAESCETTGQDGFSPATPDGRVVGGVT